LRLGPRLSTACGRAQPPGSSGGRRPQKGLTAMASHVRSHAFLAATAAAFLVIGLAAAPASATTARPAAPSRATQAATDSSPLTAQEALTEAESTGNPVVATALSTDTSTTTANPDGSLTATESSEPVQSFVDGAWTPLNADLQENSDGTYSPTVSAEPLTLSGGGGTVLATMSADARSMTISWPGTLPAPTISGATATYADVYAGVDLVVTADTQGGFSDVLVVQDATAAANPALSSLQLTVSTDGLVLSTDASGDLIAAAGSSDPPLMSFDAPQIWDSTPAPSTETTVTNGDGVVVDAASGDPVASSVSGPGADAQVASVPVSVSGDTVTLTPPASILTGSATTYPVYIDPTWHNYAAGKLSSWTQVFSGLPTDTSLYDTQEDLRVGVCPVDLAPDCNGIGVARSFFQMKLPSQLRANTDVHAAYLYMTEDWAPSCTAEAIRLYPVSGTISRSTDWDNAPAMPDTGASYAVQSAAFGYPGCGYYKDDITWNVTSTVAADVGHTSYQTWGLRADDEDTSDPAASELYWKKFKTDASYITLSVIYDDPPNQPKHLSTDPGGECHTAKTDPTVIGDDDVTFYSYASDNTGDNNLTTTFTLYNSSGTDVYSSHAEGTNYVGGNDSFAQWTLLRAAMQGFGTDGSTTAYEYYFETQTTNEFGLTSTPSDECWIYYNPAGPEKPTISFSPGTVATGGSVTADFSAPDCSSTTDPCPVSYVYQVGAAAPVTETANSSTHDWSGSITIHQVGPIEIGVYGVASGGNPGEASTQEIIGTPPSTPYRDGYYTHGSYPDMLTIGMGAEPSLWLMTGSGDGDLNSPVDIGSIGTGVNPGTDGPGDWSGAIVLHGDFTGHGVQDVMAYYPSTGNGVIIDGNGNATSLDPESGNTFEVKAGLMQSFATGTDPTDLVGAGNVSGLNTGTDDLIGISGGVELDLYTDGECQGCGDGSSYEYNTTLSTTAPDGGTDWNDYSIATAGNPSSTVLFAFDKATGALYESSDPMSLPTGNWTKITTPWTGGGLRGLIQGDINNAGQTELWFASSGVFQAYTLSGITLTAEGTATTSAVTDDWALTDGNDGALGPTVTTAMDSITGTNATITGGAAWNSDPYFATDLSLNGTSRYMTPPSDTIPIGATPTDLSVWFKTATAGGVIASVQESALTSGSTTTSGYNPVLYVGSDGLLQAKWWNGSASGLTSTKAVDDGLWHHAELVTSVESCATTCEETQILYLDGQEQGSVDALLTGDWANLDFGAGYIGGAWPDESYYEKDGNEGYLQYFKGEMADITLSYGCYPVNGATACAPASLPSAVTPQPGPMAWPAGSEPPMLGIYCHQLRRRSRDPLPVEGSRHGARSDMHHDRVHVQPARRIRTHGRHQDLRRVPVVERDGGGGPLHLRLRAAPDLALSNEGHAQGRQQDHHTRSHARDGHSG
jgi:hypothetical protein